MSARPATAFAPLTPRSLLLAVLAMGAVVLGSNVLVQYPINDWLTWGAFSYPVAFLVSNLINRRFGPAAARRVAWAGFALAVLLSIWIATPRIAVASCLAFIAAQLLDITVFDRLRRGHWWRAPMVATTCSATLDTTIFWSIAFAGSSLPWVSWALGDLAVKLTIGVFLLAPFRALLWKMAPRAV
ncbi:queuosine precursor transporter [Stenotrophomonas sp. TWI700]|uniref:queuosine precursor transporter n=1 Tax=Stenotrophomonas TaxID=40323 RepID=UPI0015A082E0|nr:MULTISPECIES: queuosine precursor transporter [unclassified Stenotrophomonas]MDX3936861.1 queuosine precursor transporter [Stenotrophomonas sp.]NWF34458.1 queuosine precursor transporter [Stenotrophomonas sp. SAM-B]